MLLHDLTLGRAGPDEDRAALVSPDGSITRRQLSHEVARLTAAVPTLAGPGGRVAIAADSRPEVVALLLAVPAAGRVAVPLNVRLTPDDLAAQMRAVGAEALIATASELDRLAPVLDAAPTVTTTVGLDPACGDVSLATLEAAPLGTGPTGRPEPTDPAWIIFTSGTTGPAKGVVLSATSLSAAVGVTAAARPLVDDDVYLYPFPLHHVSAYNVLHALHRGCPVVLPRRFDVAVVADLASRHRVTAVSLAPTMLRMLLDHGAPLPHLRTIAYGAAPMSPALLAEAHDSLRVGFAQGYGMTELSGNAVFLGPDDHRRALAGDARLLVAAGRPGPGVELAITADDGTALPPGEPGEVRVRAAQVCSGYWDDPVATAAAIDGDGWLRTGDIGVLEDDRLLTIVDRAKDLIVTGGENVASREVEDVLGQHPFVARVAVVGVPDDRWGEAVTAAVVLRPDVARDSGEVVAAIADHARHRLARFKVPKHIEVVADLPVNASGKVVKAEVRRLLARPGT